MSQISGTKKHLVPNNRHPNRLMPGGVSKAGEKLIGEAGAQEYPQTCAPSPRFGDPQ
jgi:hypothetical protein